MIKLTTIKNRKTFYLKKESNLISNKKSYQKKLIAGTARKTFYSAQEIFILNNAKFAYILFVI